MLHTTENKLKEFERLLNIMSELRIKCPWDKEQTFESLRSHSIEEVYELTDAIIRNDMQDIKKELGDMLLHIVFYAQMGSETNDFDIYDVCKSLNEKLIYRHPHVFGEVEANNAKTVEQNWEQLKLKEKDGNKTVLSGVPATLPAMIKRRKKETIITETARNSKQKAAIVRNNLNGRMKTARNSQKTATEGKETTAREITITTTGTEDRTRDGTTKTDVRKEDQIKNVHKDRNGRIRNVRNNKTVNGNSKGRNVKNAVPTTSVLPDRKEIRIRRNSQLMKSLLKNSILSLFSACLLTACNEHTVYHSYQSLPNKGWGKSDTLSFQIPITDSVPTTLRLFAEVRNSIEYPYHDLHLFISQNLQDSTVWRTDTIAFCLADSTGRWTGHGWGSIYQSETFITSVRPLHPANYTIKIMSGMKDEKLQGLSDVGIRIEKQ
jgi:gliding motility-associated lipoprotein GldH/MazG family protein